MSVNARIKQRFDYLSNWIQNDIVLLQGELAVVDCGSQIRFKIGDGAKSFTQLPFTDQSQLSTKWLAAEAVSQGIHAASVPYGFAAGAYLCANASFSQALGYDAKALSSDTYSFTWSGDDTRAIGDYYTSHGKGSFSINPLSGLSGVYIGDQRLDQVLADNRGSKISVDGVKADLNIEHLSLSDYMEREASGQLLSNELYIVSTDTFDALGKQVKNMASGTDLSDAVNLGQLTEVSARAYDTYTQSEVDQKIASAQYFKKYVVQTLPAIADADERGIYLVLSQDPETQNTYDEYVVVGEGSSKAWEKIGAKSIDLSGYKTKQTAKADPTASSTATAFIDTISQDENGVITATKKNIQAASTSLAGIVQLNNTLTSTSTTQAATANAVRALNNAKVENTVKVAGQALTADVTAATISSAIGLSNYALDSNALHKTGDETASGHKTFSSAASVGARAGTVGNASLVVGNGYATKYGAFGQGHSVSAVGDVSFAHGNLTYAGGAQSHAEGNCNVAAGAASHAEGNNTRAYGNFSHAEGTDTVVSGLVAHAEGNCTTAAGTGAHAEGNMVKASGAFAHAEGVGIDMSGIVLGDGAQAPGSHIEGFASTVSANAMASHADGFLAEAVHPFAYVWNGYAGTPPSAKGLADLIAGQQTADAQAAQQAIGTIYYQKDALKYRSQGQGTFSINPVSGTAGFFVGGESLSSMLGSKADVSACQLNDNISVDWTDNWTITPSTFEYPADCFYPGSGHDDSFTCEYIGEQGSYGAWQLRSFATGELAFEIEDTSRSLTSFSGTANVWYQYMDEDWNYEDRYMSVPFTATRIGNSVQLGGYVLGDQTSKVLAGQADISSMQASLSAKSSVSVDEQHADVNMVHISLDDYAQKVVAGEVLSNELYVISSDYVETYGQQIKNIAPGTDLSDAVNVEQLLSAVGNVQVPTDLSSFTNSPGYLVSNDISDYCQKSETSSATQIAAAIDSIRNMISSAMTSTYEYEQHEIEEQ